MRSDTQATDSARSGCQANSAASASAIQCEATARAIDEEVIALLAEVHDRVHKLLVEHRGKLERIAEVLLERETLDARELAGLIAEPT